MNIKPLRNVVVVETAAVVEKVVGSFVIAGKQAPETRGIVIAAGPECVGVSEQDEVIFVQNILRTDRDNERVLHWMTTENIIGVVKED